MAEAPYAEVLADTKGASATAFIRRAIAWIRAHDVHVERVMTDDGSCLLPLPPLQASPGA